MSSYNYYSAFFNSSNGKNKISYYVYEPKDQKPVGIVQLSHGMCEYVRRYERVAELLTSHGYVFCGNDHLGHGASADTPDDLGFTSEGGGTDNILEDLHKMTAMIKEGYPGLPLVLYGHSMGSFYARLYLSTFGKELAGAVIEGTAGSTPPASAGKNAASLLMKLKGERARSPLLDNLAFGAYNKRFGGKKASPAAWLSTCKKEVRKYEADPLCTFKFTLRGYYDLFDVLSRVSEKAWAFEVPSRLPLFLAAGAEDPVGNYGKGVREVYNRLKRAGIGDVTLKLYPGARHELHNEAPKIRDEFLSDLLNFVTRVCVGDAEGRQ